jgi:hypothetical protein
MFLFSLLLWSRKDCGVMRSTPMAGLVVGGWMSMPVEWCGPRYGVHLLLNSPGYDDVFRSFDKDQDSFSAMSMAPLCRCASGILQAA